MGLMGLDTTTEEIDRGEAALLQSIEDLKGASVTAGLHEDLAKEADHAGSEKHTDQDVTIVEVGFFNEYGTRTIPQRSFIRAAVEEQKSSINAAVEKAIKKISRGGAVSDALEMIGKAYRKAIRKTIIDKSEPPNAPSTIASKGFNNPLIDTKTMLNTVGYKVHLKGER